MADARMSSPVGRPRLLVGRDGDLGLIRAFLDRATAEGGGLLVSGEPGVGKTALLDEAAALAAAAGSRVLRSAGVQFETDVGFAVLHQLLFPFEPDVGALGPSQGAAIGVALGLHQGPPPERLVLSAAVLALLRRLAVRRPVVVVVDDLPWVDRPSAAVLGFVARRLTGSRVAFLGAARTGTAGPFDGMGLPEHEVAPLDDTAAADLLALRFPTLAPGVRRRLLAEAGGNPLALLELPTALSVGQRSAGTALPPVLPLPRRLEEVFASRVDELPGPTRRLLLLAVLEGSGSLDVLRAVAGPDTDSSLAAAENAGLVRSDRAAATLTFRHPLIRSAVADRTPLQERRRAHRALAQQLTDQPERQAWHLAEALSQADEPVASLLAETAHRLLRRGDAQGAVTRLLRAAELSPRPRDRTERLAASAAIAAGITGDVQGVATLLEDMRRRGQDLGWSLPGAVAATFVLLNSDGDAATAHRLLVRAVENRPEPYDPADDALVEALANLLMVCFIGGHTEWWVPFHDAVARFSPRAPTELYLLAATFPDPARSTPAVLDELDRAIGDLWDDADPYRIMITSAAAYYTDRLGGCREPLQRVLRDARTAGAVGLASGALDHLCREAILSGRWDEAGELADECRELSDTHGYAQQACTAGHLQAWLAALRGDADGAAERIADGVRWARMRGLFEPEVAARHVAVVAAAGRRDFEAAYQQAMAISPAGTLASHVPLALSVALDLVDSAVRTGRRDRARAHVQAMQDARLADVSPRLALITAGAAAIACDGGSADALFAAALAIPGADRWPFELARIQLAYGERLRRARAIAPARRQLTAALDTFRRLGAHPWTAHVTGELRAAGLLPAVAGRGSSVALTSQELEIARLAATGLTNKEIGARLYLSHRTVAAHLYAIFPKLGITTRAALRDALSAAGPDIA